MNTDAMRMFWGVSQRLHGCAQTFAMRMRFIILNTDSMDEHRFAKIRWLAESPIVPHKPRANDATP